MRVIKIFILLLPVLFPAVIYSQEYYVGASSASIEPDQSLISVHLGGYGAPRDGRFTLQWIRREALPAITAVCGVDDRLYTISDFELFSKNISDNDSEWEKTGKTENIIAIAGLDNTLYALNNNRDLYRTNSKKIKWKKTGSLDRSVTSLAACNNKLFAANENGEIWSSNPAGQNWEKFTPVRGIISLAASDGYLYALTGDGTIFKCRPEEKEVKWIKAAYRNNITIKEDIRNIAIAGNTIFGIDKDNVLFEGGHRSEGNLTARALAVKNGKNTVLIVTLDVCGVNDTYSALIKKEIREKYDIPASAVFINCSHTHFAPVSQNWFTWQEPNQIPDSMYLYSTVRKGIFDAAGKAIEALAPAQLYFGRGTTDIGYNRSLKDHPGLYDSSVDVVKVKYADNRESFLFLASCHAVFSTAGTLHYTISANFPGVARKLLEDRTGTTTSLFLQGTAGDINPRDNGAFISGEKLANEVFAVINKPMTEIKGGITFFLDTINIPVKPWTKEEISAYRAQNDKPGDINAEKNVKWCDLMLKYYSEGTMPSSMPVYVHTINMGDWKLVGFSRETTTEYGFGVKNIWPDKMVSVAGYTNDVSSYLPTTLHIKAKNYEGLNSFFWYGMPNTFPEGVEDIILGTIKNLSR